MRKIYNYFILNKTLLHFPSETSSNEESYQGFCLIWSNFKEGNPRLPLSHFKDFLSTKLVIYYYNE